MDSIAWIDVVGLGLVGVFCLLGIVRGLWWQVIRLLGLVLAVAVARTVTPLLTPRFSSIFPDLDERIAGGLVWFLLFVTGLLAATLIGRLGKSTIEALQLGLVDRAGGAAAGVVTGILIHAAFLVGLMRLAPSDWKDATVQGTHSAFLLDSLGHRLPLILDAQAAEKVAPWLGSEAGGSAAGSGEEPRVR